MPVPTLTPAVTGVSQLASRFMLEVDTNYPATPPAWVAAFGLNSFVPHKTQNSVDNSDFDSGIWGSNTPTQYNWDLAVGFEHKLYSGAEDPGQALLHARANAAPIQPVHVRWWDRYGVAGDDYEGVGIATWEPAGGGQADTDKVTCNITGQGARTAISNPVAVNSAPTVVSATPSGAAVGKAVTIRGANFVGATDVKFGTVSVVTGGFNVSTDGTTISAVVPAGTAGVANITVINAVGTSNALAYTRGA